MDYADGIVYGVPNQSTPGLLAFSLHFRLSNLYCDIDLEDTSVEIVWEGDNDFSASAEFQESDFTDMRTGGDALDSPAEARREIIDKGKELSRAVYS